MNCIGKTDTVQFCVDLLNRPLITKARIPKPYSVKHSRVRLSVSVYPV